VTLELWTTIATVGTFVVFTGSAIAAFVQLRHIRRGNQLPGLLSVLQIFQQPNIHELVNFVRQELPLQMQNPDFRQSLMSVPIDRRRHPELHLCELYEEIGSYIRSGLIDEELFLRAHWYNIGLYWGLLAPTIEVVRQSRPFVFENFEFLAVRSRSWQDAHPGGNFPPNMERMLTRTP
jgi:hypothetical protein